MVSDPAVFLRYLLGSRKFGTPVNGNLHDAKSVYWVLYQENCPRYVVQPVGDFSEAIYKALIVFLIETTSFGFYSQDPDDKGPLQAGDPIPFTDPNLDIRYDCLKEYFDCYGGPHEPLELDQHKPPTPEFQELLKADQDLYQRFVRKLRPPRPTMPPADESKPLPPPPKDKHTFLEDVEIFLGEVGLPSRASKVAVAGTLANKKVTLANGQQVEVIHPDLRGMSTWNTIRLLRSVLAHFHGPQDENDAIAWAFVARVVSRLYEFARNDGKAPQDRAINWAATTFLQQVRSLLRSSIVRKLIGGKEELSAGAVDTVQVRPAPCQESGGEYDVEIALFSVAEAFRGLTVISSKIDVSDVVPVTLSLPRVFNRR
jgi:hypothetical protein